jgi:hypothetical protein
MDDNPPRPLIRPEKRRFDVREKRAYERQEQTAALFWRPVHSDRRVHAEMRNYSKSGMYLESEEAPGHDTDVEVIMASETPSASGPERFLFYLGRPVWNRRVHGAEKPRYGFGVQLIQCSCDKSGNGAGTICETCDMCCAATACYEVRKTKESLYLCPTCHRQLQSMPAGHLKSAIKRFLMGNVV